MNVNGAWACPAQLLLQIWAWSSVKCFAEYLQLCHVQNACKQNPSKDEQLNKGTENRRSYERTEQGIVFDEML